jgi:hypothetical protein
MRLKADFLTIFIFFASIMTLCMKSLPCHAYENLAAKERYSQALNCTNSKRVTQGLKARQNLLQAAALDKSNKTRVGPDPNAEKYLNDAALNLENDSSINNPNHHCYQTILTLLSCYHFDNCN